jgi:hypothetical protein
MGDAFAGEGVSKASIAKITGVYRRPKAGSEKARGEKAARLHAE